MRVILHNTLSVGLAKGLGAILEELGQDKVSHIDIEYSKYIGTDKWRDFVKSDGWAILTGSMWTKWDINELDDWKELEVPVLFLPRTVMASPREKRAGQILLYWEQIRKALMRGGLSVIKGRDIVPIDLRALPNKKQIFSVKSQTTLSKLRSRNISSGQGTLF